MRVVDNVGFNVKKQDIPGGGSGNGHPLATPDWNQNDETAADYIKNRPFYTTDPMETELVNGTFAFALNGNFGIYVANDVALDLVEGETYNVTFDGVEYETVCQNFNGFTYIGSIELGIGGTPTYPFLSAPAGGIPFATNIEGVSHEITIKATVPRVVQIPDKYISDDFRNVVYVKNPKDWFEADWKNYYASFQSGKLLKLKYGGYNEKDNGYILSMFYVNSIKYVSYINQLGEIFTLGYNSTTGKCFFKPIFYNHGFYFKYNESGSSLSEKDRAAYSKIGLSASSGLVFTTKETDKSAVERKVVLEGDKELILSSSTANSTKKFKITVDDSGTLKATEVTG